MTTELEQTVATSTTANQLPQPRLRHKDYYQQLPSIVKTQLATIFLTLSENESRIETERQQLCSNNLFEPYSAFTRIDRQNQAFITGRDIVSYLSSCGVPDVAEADCNLLVKYFDSDPTSHKYGPQLDYQDFISILLPCADTYLRSRTTQRPHQRTHLNDRLEPLIERQIANLLCLEIDFLLRVEQQKMDLEGLPNFNLRHCFKAIDEARNKFIDVLAIRRFFIKVGHRPVKAELVNIMRRMDLDGDNKITFYEFREALTPIQVSLVVHPNRKDRKSQKVDSSNEITNIDIQQSYAKQTSPLRVASAAKLNTIQEDEPSDNIQQFAAKRGKSTTKKVRKQKAVSSSGKTKKTSKSVEKVKKQKVRQEETRAYMPQPVSINLQQTSHFGNPPSTLAKSTSPLRQSQSKLIIPYQNEREQYENAISPDLQRRITSDFTPVQQNNLTDGQLRRLKDEVSRTFLDQIYLEKEVEKLKLELARQLDFTCIGAFREFDVKQLNNFDLMTFNDVVLSLAGEGRFDHEQASLLYRRFAKPRFCYSEFCNMIVPCDPTSSSRLLARVASTANLSFETKELFIRLMRAHLSLAQAQEYINTRLNRQMNSEGWNADDIFEAIDTDRKGWISIYDIEKLLINHKRCGSRSLVSDVELLISLYDKQNCKQIRLYNFKQQILPQMQPHL